MPWQHTPCVLNNSGGCESLGEGMTQAEVALLLGLTCRRVQQVENNGIRAIWRMQVSQRLRNKRRQHTP